MTSLKKQSPLEHMEKHITYDLIDNEVIMWCVQSKKETKKKVSVAMMRTSEGMLTVVIAFIGFIALCLGTNIKYWGVLLGVAIIIGLFNYTRFIDIDKFSDLFYYVTDRRVIAIRTNDKKRIIRTQFLKDISKVYVRIKTKGRASVFFSPAKNIDIYEVKNDPTNSKRDINAHAPMSFLSVEDSRELVNILRMNKHINIEVD